MWHNSSAGSPAGETSQHTLESEEDEEGKVVFLLRGVLDLGEEAEVVVGP